MRIGILGGGQLARMLALAGYPLGLNFSFYEPKQPCCMDDWRYVTHADYLDIQVLQKFAEQVDLITYENENIPIKTVEQLKQFKPVYPDQQALYYSQDRLHEKQLFTKLQIPTTQFIAVNTYDDLLSAAKQIGFPFLLKTRRGGYDGKGQFRFHTEQDLQKFRLEPLDHGYIAEAFITFQREVSCIGVRNVNGDNVFYPLCENKHKDGILAETQVKVNDPLFEQAKQHLQKVLTELQYVGTLVIEFFDVNGELYVNEMAPRVHNSGHWTIEGATTSQFENHVRAIANWPLGDTTSIATTKMINIIGQWPEKITLLKTPGLHIHDYHKKARPGRKLGHLTLTHLSSIPFSKSKQEQIK